MNEYRILLQERRNGDRRHTISWQKEIKAGSVQEAEEIILKRHPGVEIKKIFIRVG